MQSIKEIHRCFTKFNEKFREFVKDFETFVQSSNIDRHLNTMLGRKKGTQLPEVKFIKNDETKEYLVL